MQKRETSCTAQNKLQSAIAAELHEMRANFRRDLDRPIRDRTARLQRTAHNGSGYTGSVPKPHTCRPTWHVLIEGNTEKFEDT